MESKQQIFKHIPRIDRKIYPRTFMNEISLVFTYNPIQLDEVFADIERQSRALEIPDVKRINEPGKNSIEIKGKDALITFTSNAVVVSVSASEYKDFNKTEFVWDLLETLMSCAKINPIIWSFTKGNAFIFNKAIPEGRLDDVLRLVLSENLLKLTDDKHLFVEESIDKTRVLACRYGFEKNNNKDCLSLKTMIVSQAYAIKDIKSQVFEVNNLIFEGWHWCISKDIETFMNSPKL